MSEECRRGLACSPPSIRPAWVSVLLAGALVRWKLSASKPLPIQRAPARGCGASVFEPVRPGCLSHLAWGGPCGGVEPTVSRWLSAPACGGVLRVSLPAPCSAGRGSLRAGDFGSGGNGLAGKKLPRGASPWPRHARAVVPRRSVELSCRRFADSPLGWAAARLEWRRGRWELEQRSSRAGGKDSGVRALSLPGRPAGAVGAD